MATARLGTPASIFGGLSGQKHFAQSTRVCSRAVSGKSRRSVVSMVSVSAKETPALPLPPPGPNRLHELYQKGGQSPWIDNLTRDWSASGHLEELVKRGVRGLTSNPTTFEKALAASDVYDGQIRDLVAKAGLTSADVASRVEEIYWGIALTDIANAAAIMRALHDESSGVDGFVSLEVSPALARDTEGTAAVAGDLHKTLSLPNLMVKIPATREGLPAIRQVISQGRSINVTLIFSLQRYGDVIEAYISGLEALAAADPQADLSHVASVASFFVSRVDGTVDAKLDAIGTPEALALRGKAAVAQAVMAYQLFLERFSGPRWEALTSRGARVQRPLWASTGVKNKAYPDTLYVDSLIGPHTVNTMPDATLLAFADHGKVERTVDADVAGARKTLQDIASLGIDLEVVSQDLEEKGVQSFAKSFDSLLDTLGEKVRGMI